MAAPVTAPSNNDWQRLKIQHERKGLMDFPDLIILLILHVCAFEFFLHRGCLILTYF